jgi:hypothetical protein
VEEVVVNFDWMLDILEMTGFCPALDVLEIVEVGPLYRFCDVEGLAVFF